MNRRRAIFPTLDHVWLFAAASLIALRPLLTPVPPNDFWWHMATGRLIVQQWFIPVVDTFSYTRAGEPFFNQSWLAQILMYGLYQFGGVPLLVFVQAGVLALAYWLLLRLCILRSGSVRLSVGLLLMTTLPLSFDNWLVRPQSYTFPIFTAYLYILTTYRLGRSNRLWLLPLLMVVWVNLHGSFVLGGALIAFTLAGEWLKRRLAAWREETSWAERPIGTPDDVLTRTKSERQPSLLPLIGWGIVTALALLANPRGVAVLSYVRNLLTTSAVTSLVTEWAPPTTRDIGGVIFFLFLLICIGVLAYARRTPDLTDMLLAGAFLWLALGAVRNIVWFGMIATPLLVAQAATIGMKGDGPPAIRTAFPIAHRGVPALNWILIDILSLMLMLGLPWVKPLLDLPPELGALLSKETPVQVVACMRDQQPRSQRLFNNLAAGSYLIWALPEQKVFIDPRIELYPYEQWRDYINLGAGNNTEELLAKYRFDAALLNNQEQANLLKRLKVDSDWVVRCADDQNTYVVRVRK